MRNCLLGLAGNWKRGCGSWGSLVSCRLNTKIDKNITKFKFGNVTQYLMFEALDIILHEPLLNNTDVLSLAQPSDGV